MRYHNTRRQGSVLATLFLSSLLLLIGLSAFALTAGAAGPKITWTPATLDQILAPGSVRTFVVSFTSSENIRRASLGFSTSLQGVLAVSPQDFPITAGQPNTVKLTVTIAANAYRPEYNGELMVLVDNNALADSLKLRFRIDAPASPTPTRTAQPTATPTRTATPTGTPTRTATPTATASGTATRTATPTQTQTQTKTPTRTPTPRATATKTIAPLFLLAPATKTPTPVLATTGLGLERFWTFQQFRVTDRLTLYVNLWDGNLVAQVSEFAIPSRGLPLALTHSYNSQAALASNLGFDWTHSLDAHVVDNGNTAVFYDGDGTQHTFTSAGGGIYTSPAGNFDLLTRPGGTSFTLTHKDQSKHLFELNNGTTWLLTKIQDRFGNTITLNYDGSKRLINATAAGGQSLTLTNDPTTGTLSSIADNATHTFNYVYNSRTGDLTSVTDPLRFTTTFTYNKHLLTTIGDPRTTQTQITYDASNRVKTITVGGTLIATFGYSAGITTFTDGNGKVTTYTINGTGQVTQLKDALNNTTNYSYDANRDVTQVIDALSRTTTSAYDSLGNLTIYTDTLSNATRYTYNSTNDLLSVTDPLIRTTNYGYDGLGNLTVITDALGFTTNYAYNSFGQRLSVTDANSHTTGYGYNSAGYVITTTDALSNLAQYGYDAIGNRTVITDARSNVTTFIYDANNRLLSTTIPLTGTQTATTSYGYDSVSNRTVITDAMGSVSRFAYDALNRLVSTTLPLTGTQTALTQYGYDAVGNRTVITDANSHLTRYGYDALNRTTVITDASSNTTKYGYDAVSNRTVITDALGNATRYTYDNLNRVITITNPTGKTQGFTYDAVSNRLTSTDELTRTTRYAYDGVNRVISTTNPLTQTTQYAYDKVGNTTIITSATGLTTTLTYWETNWLKTKSTPIGITQYAYDSVGNLTTLTEPSLAAQNFVYDKANRVVQEQDRDAGSNLIVTLSYQYDANSNRLSETESRLGNSDRVTAYTYDKANRLITTSDPNNNRTTYTYDAVGNQTNVTDPLGITTIITPTQINLPGTIAHYQGSTLLDNTNNTFDNNGNLSSARTTGDNRTMTNTLQYNGNNYLGVLTMADQGSNSSNSFVQTATYANTNLVSGISGDTALFGNPPLIFYYDAANRWICRQEGLQIWRYDSEGRRTDQFGAYGATITGGTTCAERIGNEDIAHHEHTFYTYTNGYLLTSRAEDHYFVTTFQGHTNDSTYQYDGQGYLTQELRHDYLHNVTSTMTYTWEAATNRLVGFARDTGSIFTTTLQYDSRNRIVARYTASYSTTYTYVGESDWLLKETKYPSGGAAFDLVQYRYISPKLMRIVLRDGGACNIVNYLQMNWHGDFYRWYSPNGDSFTVQQGDEWGVWLSTPLACGAPHSYRWNAQWGYMFFSDFSAPNGADPPLGLYYVHGRWYNPEVGLFISPDEKGEYFYGSGQDPVDDAWIVNAAVSFGQSGDIQRQIVLGGGQFIVETANAGQCAIYQPPGSDVLWCATRVTVPVVVIAAPVVYGGLSAAHAGAAYLVRTLLGRVATSATAVCAVEEEVCANAEQQLVTTGLKGLQLSPHALQRMSERGVSFDQLQRVVNNAEPFRYFHESVWKTGYYDPISKIFVGTVNDIVTTVIANVTPQYIENLKKVIP